MPGLQHGHHSTHISSRPSMYRMITFDRPVRMSDIIVSPKDKYIAIATEWTTLLTSPILISAVREELEETSRTQRNEKSAGRDRLLDDMKCLLAYGAPTPGDPFENDLAAEMPSGNLPLWAAQIKRSRLEDKDWIEGGQKHRYMILRQLHRYQRVADGFWESPLMVVAMPPLSNIQVPTAVFRMLPVWRAMFLNRGLDDSVQYDGRKDCATIWLEMDDEHTYITEFRLNDPLDEIHTLPANDYVGALLATLVSYVYADTVLEKVKKVPGALDDSSAASSSKSLGTATKKPKSAKTTKRATASKTTSSQSASTKATTTSADTTDMSEKAKGKIKAKPTQRDSAKPSVSKTSSAVSKLCECSFCRSTMSGLAVHDDGDEHVDTYGSLFDKSSVDSNEDTTSTEPSKSFTTSPESSKSNTPSTESSKLKKTNTSPSKSCTFEAEVTAHKDGDEDVFTVSLPPVTQERLKEGFDMLQRKLGIDLGFRC